MSSRTQDDDWFAEAETQESPRSVWRRRPEVGFGGRRHRPQARRPGARVAIWKLLVATVVVIALPVALVAATAGNNPAGADRSYLGSLSGPARDSALVGDALSARLHSGTLSMASLRSAISGLLRRQRRDFEAAAAISPAPRLRGEQQNALDALGLRVDGLAALQHALRQSSVTSPQLAAAAERLVTSDVIWHDFFQRLVQAQLAREGARGVRALSSTFLTNPELVAPDSFAALLHRLRHPPAPTGATLKLGTSGHPVSAWQRELNRWLARSGQPRLAVTGTYDAATQRATVRLQQATHITPDGVVGPVTRAALTKALAG